METVHASLVSVQVGGARALGADGAADPFDQPWTTGIFKTPVSGPVFLGHLGVEGDTQVDPVNHGGADKSVCVYSADHYEWWRERLDIVPFDYGAFGENLTLQGVIEDGVCIGDIWSVGGAVRVQVSQPRQPCWKLARKWRVRDLVDQVVKSGRTGWYFRVLREGVVQAGDAVALVERPCPEWTITAANGVMHHRAGGRRAAAALAAVEALSDSWRATLEHRLDT
jgi:MOSC domain-containing protein YiiM